MKVIVALGKILFIHSMTACCQKMGEKLGKGHYYIRSHSQNALFFILDEQEISFCPFCGQNINIIAKRKHELERSAGK